MADHDTHDHTGVPGAGAPTEILDIPTAEMDDSLVLAPDGAGGVEFRAESGGGGFPSGTSFPGSPSTNDRFTRTDRLIDYTYDGAQWLSDRIEMGVGGLGAFTTNIATSPSTIHYWPVDLTYGMYIEFAEFVTFVLTTNNGSNFWTVQLNRTSTNNTPTSLGTTSTVADTASNWVRHTITVNGVLDSSAREIDTQVSKTSAPGNLWVIGKLVYRLIG